MSTKKTRLVRGDQYGLLKATELAAQMIAAFDRRRDGATEMRVEAIGDEVWDDIHLMCPRSVETWQVKRLKADVAEETIRPLLASAAQATPGLPRRLRLGVASFVAVASGKKLVLELRDLSDLCEAASKSGLSPADFEATLEKRLAPAYAYASECIGSGDPAAVVAALERLRVLELGSEEDLRAAAAAHLQAVFRNPDELVKELESWLTSHNDGAIAITPMLLYHEVVERHGDRDPSAPRWIHLTRNAVTMQWEVRGPLRLAKVVEGAWSDQPVRVQLGAEPFDNDPASAALSRLALHQARGTQIEATNGPAWKDHCSSICAGTLGVVAEKPVVPCSSLSDVPPHPPQDQATGQDLAARLSEQMNDIVWGAYVERVARQLHEHHIGKDLRDVMQTMWGSWNAALAASPFERASFLRSMLSTAEEWRRAGFDAAARTGSKLVDNLARTTVAALAVSATLEASGVSVGVGLRTDGSADNLRFGTVAAHAIALGAASHPVHRAGWELLDAPGALLSLEGGIAILGAIGASERELFDVACSENVPYHASESSTDTYRHTGRPFPILTAGPRFRQAMREGLLAMKTYLGMVLGEMNEPRVEGLRQTAAGATTSG